MKKNQGGITKSGADRSTGCSFTFSIGSSNFNGGFSFNILFHNETWKKILSGFFHQPRGTRYLMMVAGERGGEIEYFSRGTFLIRWNMPFRYRRSRKLLGLGPPPPFSISHFFDSFWQFWKALDGARFNQNRNRFFSLQSFFWFFFCQSTFFSYPFRFPLYPTNSSFPLPRHGRVLLRSPCLHCTEACPHQQQQQQHPRHQQPIPIS